MSTQRREEPLRLADLLAALSLATDLGMGLPHETALRVCVLATLLPSLVKPWTSTATSPFHMGAQFAREGAPRSNSSKPSLILSRIVPSSHR